MDSSVCAIVLGYGSLDDIAHAVESLQAAVQPPHIVLVQNGLSDELTDQFAGLFPTVEVVRNARNLGAAGGRNMGLDTESARNADYIFFLDRDATVEPDALARLVDAARQLPDAGLLGALIRVRENRGRIHSAGGMFDRHSGEVHLRQVPPHKFEVVDFVVTTAALVSARALMQVGTFDERYFAYYEDLDWARRALEAGFRHYVVRDAVGYHNEERSRFTPMVSYLVGRNRLLFQTRRPGLRGRLSRQTLRLSITDGWMGLLVVLSMRTLSATCFVAQLQGMFDFWRGRFGPAPRWTQSAGVGQREMRFWNYVRNSRLFRRAQRFKQSVFSKSGAFRG